MSKKNLPGNIMKPSPLDTVEGLKMLAEAYMENRRISETEKTKREAIEAQKETIIEEIRAKKEILKDFFDKSFAERDKNFDKLFEGLDKTLEKNDNEALTAFLGAITELAKTSPVSESRKLLEDYRNPDKDEIII